MKKAQLALAVVVVAATRMIACGSSVSSGNYDKTCETAADCVAVGVGDPCSTPCEGFPSADAISRKALETYNYDAFSAQYSCSHCGTVGQCAENPALTQSAYCVQGACTLCNSADPCSCAPKDPSCIDGGIVFEGGTDAETDSPAEAAPPVDAPTQQDSSSQDAPAQHDAPTQDGPTPDSSSD